MNGISDEATHPSLYSGDTMAGDSFLFNNDNKYPLNSENTSGLGLYSMDVRQNTYNDLIID